MRTFPVLKVMRIIYIHPINISKYEKNQTNQRRCADPLFEIRLKNEWQRLLLFTTLLGLHANDRLCGKKQSTLDIEKANCPTINRWYWILLQIFRFYL